MNLISGTHNPFGRPPAKFPAPAPMRAENADEGLDAGKKGRPGKVQWSTPAVRLAELLLALDHQALYRKHQPERRGHTPITPKCCTVPAACLAPLY